MPPGWEGWTLQDQAARPLPLAWGDSSTLRAPPGAAPSLGLTRSGLVSSSPIVVHQQRQAPIVPSRFPKAGEDQEEKL